MKSTASETTREASDSAALIEALRDPACYLHPVTRIEVLQTHISWVILTGRYAYKIKKPVNPGFLDFTTLQARHHYCQAELRLNRRFAPALYEAVVAITGSAAHPLVARDEDGGERPVIEYALRMRQFAQHALAANLLSQGTLNGAHIEALTARMAAFHAHAARAAQGAPYGTPDAVINAARDNLTQLARWLPGAEDQTHIGALREWTEREFNTHWALFRARHVQGFVRECHGDLHLGNIVMLDGALTPFDCIEFDPALRWIDVLNDVAFLVMDLADRGRADLASRCLNAYLEATGDYAGLQVLRFYGVYRALVRAKVHALRAHQNGVAAAEGERLTAAARAYLTLAQHSAHDARHALILMHGFSGSGKSLAAQAVADDLGALRLRSDVTRKRLCGLIPLQRSSSALAAGLYSDDLTRATYHHLLDDARAATRAGYPVVIDATFLQRWQRDVFRREAAALGVPLLILAVSAPESVLRARITERRAAGADASEADLAVLAHQLAQAQALGGDELAQVVNIDSTGDDVLALQRAACAAVRARCTTNGHPA